MNSAEQHRHLSDPLSADSPDDRPPNRVVKLLAVLTGIMLLAAVLPLNSDYYLGLRWMVMVVSLLVVWDGWQASQADGEGRRSWLLMASPVLLLLAILFNPIYPVWMERAQWRPVNILGGLILLQYPLISFAQVGQTDGSKVWVGIRGYGVMCLVAAAMSFGVIVSSPDPLMEDVDIACDSPLPGECP
ncbi:DUF6804 family protein [Ornithinimicrobium tianjinense]|nr:DUF6804 family protein [Ornithinimicrobium tianjinense]